MELTVIDDSYITLYSIVQGINKERNKVRGDEGYLDHSKQMGKVTKLALEPSFGRVAKMSAPTYNPDGSTNKEVETYKLNKTQAISAGAKIDNKRLMLVVTALEEALKPKQLTRKEMALQVIAQEEELERLGIELVEVQQDKQQLVEYVRKEHAPSLITISITEFASTWVKQQRLSAQQINACFYGMKVYDKRFLGGAMQKVNSHIPSTKYRNHFKSDVEHTRGYSTWYEIEVYQEHAETLALMLTELSDDNIQKYWDLFKELKDEVKHG